MNDNKDAFNLWWEFAEKPLDSPLTIDAEIHCIAARRAKYRAKVNEAVREELRLGPFRPAGSPDLDGVPKATEEQRKNSAGKVGV